MIPNASGDRIVVKDNMAFQGKLKKPEKNEFTTDIASGEKTKEATVALVGAGILAASIAFAIKSIKG